MTIQETIIGCIADAIYAGWSAVAGALLNI